MPVQAMFIQDGRDPLLQALDGGLGREAEVEHRRQVAGDHVGGAGTGIEVGNLEAGRREEGVAVIPMLGSQLGQAAAARWIGFFARCG